MNVKLVNQNLRLDFDIRSHRRHGGRVYYTYRVGNHGLERCEIIPTTKSPATFGISLAVKANVKGSDKRSGSKKGKAIKCQAYEQNTDFPQRPGGIFTAITYHMLTLFMMLMMVGHQTLRGLMPASLPTIYKFVPALSGKLGLSGSGLAMLYVASQIMSYSIGKIHVISAILLYVAGFINIVAGCVGSLASCQGMDPYADWAGGPSSMAYQDEFEARPSGSGAAMDPEAPDPYDGKDPGENNLDYDGEDGVGASAPPPQTFGAPPPGVAPLQGYAAGNAETNPQLLASGVEGNAVANSEVVFDPSTGTWSTVQKPVSKQTDAEQTSQVTTAAPAMPLPTLTLPYPSHMGMAYDAYGRPMMPPPMPSLIPPWAQMPTYGMPSQVAMPSTVANSKAEEPAVDPKRLARKEAKKQYERMRQAQEKAEIEEERRRRLEEAEMKERKERRRVREQERQIRRYEREQIRKARAIAEEEAKQRGVKERAQDDALRRKNKAELIDKRQQAIDDARRLTIERERSWREQEEAAREAQDLRDQAEAEKQRLALQAQALAAVHEAAELGAAAHYIHRDHDSYLTRASARDGYAPEHYEGPRERKLVDVMPGHAYMEEQTAFVPSPTVAPTETESARERLYMQMEQERQRVIDAQYNEKSRPRTEHDDLQDYIRDQTNFRATRLLHNGNTFDFKEGSQTDDANAWSYDVRSRLQLEDMARAQQAPLEETAQFEAWRI